MKKSLLYEEILSYHRGELKEKEKEEVKKIINSNEVYRAILAGLEKTAAEAKEDADTVIENAKNRFLKKFLSFSFAFLTLSIPLLEWTSHNLDFLA